MRNAIIVSFLLLMLLTAAAVCADFENPVYSPEFIAEQEQLLAGVETTFPRLLLQKTFDGTNKPDVSKPQAGVYTAARLLNGKRERTLAVYKPLDENLGWGDSYFETTGSYADFYASIEGQLIERDDNGNGHIWFQYTDGDIVGSSSRNSATIEFPVCIKKYETEGGVRTYTTVYDLSEYNDVGTYDPHRFEIIRLNGYTSFFIDRKFITGFEDGFTGRFYQLFGAGMYAGGSYVTVQFDNFILRVNNK